MLRSGCVERTDLAEPRFLTNRSLRVVDAYNRYSLAALEPFAATVNADDDTLTTWMPFGGVIVEELAADALGSARQASPIGKAAANTTSRVRIRATSV
jgi:hypothetical protein